MSSFHTPWASSRSSSGRSSRTDLTGWVSNRTSRTDLAGWVSSRTSRVDLTDTTAFPDLDGVATRVATTGDIVTDLDDYTVSARPWYIFDESESDSDTTDALPPGWVLLTSADARKPKPKPIVDLGSDSEDDEDTMPMTTAKRVPKPKTRTEPYIELTGAELLELFRIDVARHDREVADRENDLYDDYSEDGDLDWNRRTDPYFGAIDDYANEEDGEDEDEYYEYE